MRLIDADILYEGLKVDEELARDRVIDTPNSFPNGTLNPSAIRYMAQLSERTRFKEIVYDAPAIDAMPVRHGRWLYSCVYGKVEWVCNQCEQDANTKTKYCPHCGARMVEDE